VRVFCAMQGEVRNGRWRGGMSGSHSQTESLRYEEAIRYACSVLHKDRHQLTRDDLQDASHQATHEGLLDMHRALANLFMFPVLRQRYLGHPPSGETLTS
jgi:hypothetical protein